MKKKHEIEMMKNKKCKKRGALKKKKKSQNWNTSWKRFRNIKIIGDEK